MSKITRGSWGVFGVCYVLEMGERKSATNKPATSLANYLQTGASVANRNLSSLNLSPN